MMKNYSGTLRPKITPLADGRIRVEWMDEEGVAIWTEGVKPKEGCGFMAQIECTGEFKVSRDNYMVDADGKRHFVLDAEEGRIGAVFGG